MILEFDWHLTNRCNFYCEYCHPQIRRVLNERHLDEPPSALVVERFNDLGRTCAIHMSGGEPFLYPDFVELCQGLTQRHTISINTNLSTPNVRPFAEAVDPARVTFVTAAIHAPERQRLGRSLDEFAESYALLRAKGFAVTALYILYPPLLEQCGGEMEYLRQRGVDRLVAKVFKGAYQHRRYPEGYSESERAKVLALSGTYKFNGAYMDGEMSFTGQLCKAGMSSFKINVTGEVQRCASVKRRSFGNLYTGTFVPDGGPTPCEAHRVLVLSQCHAYLVTPPATRPHST